MDEDTLLQRIAELERRLDWLYVATGHGYAASAPPAVGTAGGAVSAAVLDLVRQGDKIAAIKQYREETGLGLREAKDAIDALG